MTKDCFITCDLFKQAELKAITDTNAKWIKSAKFYDKISKEQLSKAVIRRRIEVGLINTFYLIINSEDFVEELKAKLLKEQD